MIFLRSAFRYAFWFMVATLALALLSHVAVTGQEPSCTAGIVLGTGTLDAADHELQDGAASVGGYTLFVNRLSPPVTWAYIRQMQGQGVELILRPAAPRTLKSLKKEQ